MHIKLGDGGGGVYSCEIGLACIDLGIDILDCTIGNGDRSCYLGMTHP